ncbi:MAG: hypothetical protein CM1200mP6_05570 [Anaerolineaceae bacterium]|nr:MAG: hypothetical protein CM1200mP6_05570 [Anaerolineaceae bacterium]
MLIGTPEWATKGLPHRGVPEGLYLPVSDLAIIGQILFGASYMNMVII